MTLGLFLFFAAAMVCGVFAAIVYISKKVLERSGHTHDSQLNYLGNELVKIAQMVQSLEKDRAQKFGALEEKLAQSAAATQNLSQATQSLSSVIGNNQLRGQWGQRMAEDILRAAGLEEGIHYLKEKSQESVQTRPDYTFLLPGERKVYMDVKFPLNNYLEWANAQDKTGEEKKRNDFLRDVKNRIRELKKRDYINVEEDTLDYVILFIPNEQIFGVIHRLSPEIMNEALSQKVLLTSPYSLFGVLSIIRQAYDNFHFQKSTHEILKVVQLFAEDYELFKKRFDDIGKELDAAKEKYLDVREKSFKRLDAKIKKIEDFKKGQEELEQKNIQNPTEIVLQ